MKKIEFQITDIRRMLQNRQIKLLSEKYINITAHLKCQCLQCEFQWETRWADLRRGHGCKKCAAKRNAAKLAISHPKLLTHVFVKQNLAKRKINLLSTQYQNNYTPLECLCLVCAHEWKSAWGRLKNHGCPRCSYIKVGLFLTDQQLERRVKRAGFEFVGRAGKNSKVKVRCQVCNHIQTVIVSDITRCYSCHPHKYGAAEDKVRIIIENLTGWKFPKTHPEFLRGRNGSNLQLDGYNEEHGIAFEYQGQDHYIPNWRKKDKTQALADLESLKRRDNRKRMQCLRHGVRLIRVPYWKKDMESFIQSKL